MLKLAGLALCAATAAAAPLQAKTAAEPLGFDQLYMSHNESAETECAISNFPAYVKGTFIIPSLGQFEIGDQSFVGLLDGFGKLHRFSVAGGKVCYTTRMMNTSFYEMSVAQGSVAAGMLFMETEPPRTYNGMDNMRAPNDNVFVNSYNMDGSYRLVTDSQTSLIFDPLELTVTSKLKWDDSLDRMVLPLGSAHPLPDPRDASMQCILDVHPQDGIRHKETLVYRICPDKPQTRVLVTTYISDYMPYFHSWGVTPTYVVLPIMHFTLDMFGTLMKGETLDKAFTPQDMGRNSTTLALVPLDGTQAIEFTVPGIVYYTHVMNTYENSTSVIFDFVGWHSNPFVSAISLDTYRTPAKRNAMTVNGAAMRIVMHTSGPLKGTASMVTFPNCGSPKATTDFPAINPLYMAKPYCIFYAVQWRFGGVYYADMAIIKRNVCTGEFSAWYADNAYPSEPRFIPDPAGTKEDQGTLLFTVMSGKDLKTSLVTVDAQTMTTIATTEQVPIIGFTTHGEFYPDE